MVVITRPVIFMKDIYMIEFEFRWLLYDRKFNRCCFAADWHRNSTFNTRIGYHESKDGEVIAEEWADVYQYCCYGLFRFPKGMAYPEGVAPYELLMWAKATSVPNNGMSLDKWMSLVQEEAYFAWEREGCLDGQHERNWLETEVRLKHLLRDSPAARIYDTNRQAPAIVKGSAIKSEGRSNGFDEADLHRDANEPWPHQAQPRRTDDCQGNPEAAGRQLPGFGDIDARGVRRAAKVRWSPGEAETEGR